MSLDLYAIIEPYLGFDEEKEFLHDIYLEKLKHLNAKKVLDIGCGSGSFLLKAKKNGIDIEGIDLSKEMVKRALEKGVSAKAIDLCKLEKKYDAAVAIFDVLNYLDKKEIKRFLKCVDNVLVDGGYFICDINTLYGFKEVAQGVIAIDKEDRYIVLDAEFEKNILLTKIDYFEKVENCYKKYSGFIKQYYHEIDQLKEVKNLKIVDIDFVALYSDISDKAILIYKKGKI
ncbi:class I SAM-dependent DNA methyltransferase [Nitrosophilus kaiyonis]|uniref:class I SAM-dependent DNA methyltransferase n=1 Tax=Nitrosophilus kaiyonis TaxID=2930200 RepID=UPI002490146F|nr:class I SAM-dependent methyltransferase [Nitrosophilus kaiyonis]